MRRSPSTVLVQEETDAGSSSIWNRGGSNNLTGCGNTTAGASGGGELLHGVLCKSHDDVREFGPHGLLSGLHELSVRMRRGVVGTPATGIAGLRPHFQTAVRRCECPRHLGGAGPTSETRSARSRPRRSTPPSIRTRSAAMVAAPLQIGTIGCEAQKSVASSATIECAALCGLASPASR